MPYCPKCDMEFVDGITICSDCKGPLAQSEEIAKAMKKQEEAQNEIEREPLADTDMPPTTYEQVEKLARHAASPGVYVKKSQKYDDLKSSASAFLLVGIILLAASLLFWTGIINLPMVGISKIIFQTAITAMGLFALIVSIHSSQSAKQLTPQIEDENQATENLTNWFLTTYDSSTIDQTISDLEELSPEELTLKRFQLIQDYLITNHDLPDTTYVDALSEEIYSKLYE